MSDSADDPCGSESESAIENVDLLGNDDAIQAEDVTHLQSKEWSSSECSEVSLKPKQMNGFNPDAGKRALHSPSKSARGL